MRIARRRLNTSITRARHHLVVYGAQTGWLVSFFFLSSRVFQESSLVTRQTRLGGRRRRTPFLYLPQNPDPNPPPPPPPPPLGEPPRLSRDVSKPARRVTRRPAAALSERELGCHRPCGDYLRLARLRARPSSTTRGAEATVVKNARIPREKHLLSDQLSRSACTNTKVTICTTR